MQSESPKKDQNELNSQSEDEIDHLFPRITTKQFKQYIQTLAATYQKTLHSRQLINYCYRCPEALITAAYTEFKNIHHPQLQQPTISAFFTNECFTDLKQLGKYLEGQSEYPGYHISTIPKNLKTILNQIFEANGYIPNFERFLLFFPSYLEKHVLLQKELFEGDKIDIKLAYFLAFCGAAQMSSIYMMVRYYHKFKAAGGDLRWINQAKYPQKYKIIMELNRILAKAVWEITEDFMLDLYENSGYQWNPSEISIILQILAFSHQNSTIALALGLNCQDPIGKHQILNIKSLQNVINQYRNKTYTPSENKEQLAVAITHLKEEVESANIDITSKQTTTSLKKSLKKVEGDEEVEQYMKQIGAELSKQQLAQQINKSLQPLLSEHKIIEKRRQNKYPTIDYSEYNFTFMAYPKLNNLTQKIADKFLNLINYSQTMTRDSFGSQKSCTKQFRKTMRYYAQNLCGYRHHEFDFKTSVSLHLPLALKFYIRLLTLSPVLINQHVIRQIHHESGQIECFDIGHVAVIIANTRMSLELTLALRAFEID